MTENIRFKCGTLQLEGLLTEQSDQKAVIITHPHPLYGGNMDNHVVKSIEKAFIKTGFSSFRFNFRGTGNSTGTFDEGNGETEDVRAAIRYLADKQFERIVLAGYSFGARVNAHTVSSGARVSDHIMISPPVAFMTFDDIPALVDTGLVITGENDEIAPPDQILAHISRWKLKTDFRVIPGCDHFYSGCRAGLEDIIFNYLNTDGGL